MACVACGRCGNAPGSLAIAASRSSNGARSSCCTSRARRRSGASRPRSGAPRACSGRTPGLQDRQHARASRSHRRSTCVGAKRVSSQVPSELSCILRRVQNWCTRGWRGLQQLRGALKGSAWVAGTRGQWLIRSASTRSAGCGGVQKCCANSARAVQNWQLRASTWLRRGVEMMAELHRADPHTIGLGFCNQAAP